MPPSSSTDSLRIATEHYYWKPGKALFHAVQVEEYARTGVCFEHPVMDLGCSNGIFSEMLRERGILDSVDVALDYSAKDLWRVKRNVVYGVIQGDARDLPLKSGTIASVLANDLLSSVTTDVSRALSEIYRVLSSTCLDYTPGQMLNGFSARWTMEVTFEEARAHRPEFSGAALFAASAAMAS